MTDYTPEIRAAALAHGLEPDLVTAVVLQESDGHADAFRYEPGVWTWFQGNPKAAGLCARRAASSYGLMQILYATATDLGLSTDPEYLFLPKVNLDFGCRYLAMLLKWADGDVAKALAAYNGGKNGANRAQPKKYAQKVLARLTAIQAAERV